MCKRVVRAIIAVLSIRVPAAHAGVELPTYAVGRDLHGELMQKGHAITMVLSLLVAILAIIGLLVGAANFALGNGERGRAYVAGGVIALLLATSAYAIAALIAS